MAGRVALGGLVGRVDPHADDLAGGAHGDVERNGQADGGRGLQVGGQPAQQRRDAGKGAGRGDDEAAVAVLTGVS